jgi:hypothetical protein
MRSGKRREAGRSMDVHALFNFVQQPSTSGKRYRKFQDKINVFKRLFLRI